MSTWKDTYESLVYEIEATITDRPNAVEHLYRAVLLIVDVDTMDSAGGGRDASIYLLKKLHKLYLFAKDNYYFREERDLVVYAINYFTEQNFGDLTEFVNSISWQDGCVPYNWTDISTRCGFDTSEWVSCS